MDSKEPELRDEDEVVDRALSIFMVFAFLFIFAIPIIEGLGLIQNTGNITIYAFTGVCLLLVAWLLYVTTTEEV